jgi:N12 class adenine-specific DNA methylase
MIEQELPSFDGVIVNSLEYKRIANQRFYLRNKETEKARAKKWRQSNPEKYKIWAEKNKEKRRAASRKFEYNISPEQYEAKKTEQGNVCAICKKESDLLVVDHNHSCCSQRKTCGKCNRGLLCRSCNTLIGLAEESKEILSNAIEYLRGYSQCQS